MTKPPFTLSAEKHEALIGAFDLLFGHLDRANNAAKTIHALLTPEPEPEMDFDPADPANKIEGSDKLTERGAEICYRLFDAGKTRYAVAAAMSISFGAATHRYRAWEKAGGVNRKKMPLQ